MAFGTLAFDTLQTSDSKNSGTNKTLDTSFVYNGSAKAFCSWGHTNHPNGIETFNIASITDTGTGENKPNLTNNMAAAEAPATSGGVTYYGSGGSTHAYVCGLGPVGSEHTTSQFRHLAVRNATGPQDGDYMVIVVHGEVA